MNADFSLLAPHPPGRSAALLCLPLSAKFKVMAGVTMKVPGQVAVISGGSRGIGAAAVRMFVAAGAKVPNIAHPVTEVVAYSPAP